jgi:hypothetical protein
MIGGGPFRDTVRPMIVHARAQLERLRAERAKLQARHEQACTVLDQKCVPADLAVPEPEMRFSWRSFNVGLLWGAFIGLLTWLMIFANPR